MIRTLSVIILLLLATSIIIPIQSVGRAEKVYVAIIWHYHQPWYYSGDGSYFILPWVRMHSVGNYYKMAYILQKYPDIRVTFTFSGSLLVQLHDYVVNRKMDYRQIISWKIARGENLTVNELFSMLRIPGGFFDINWNRIVNVVPRYRELRDTVRQLFDKYSGLPEEEFKKKVVESLSEQDYVDLAVLFNLFWIDPQVLREQYPELYSLRVEALRNPNIHFTREDLAKILKVHEDIMSKIIPLYSELAAKGQVELIPVPYSHPIAPLLVDFGWREDLALHVEKSIELFKNLLNYNPKGMWPAEEAVNQPSLEVMSEHGIKWVVTDENLLVLAGIDASPVNLGKPWFIEFNGTKLYVFFRNTDLSNRLSFQYSGWNADQAVNDLVNTILSLGAKGARIVVIALDGENPWEHYQEFGDVFLNKLYSRLSELQKQGVLETITPGEFIEKYGDTASELPLRTYDYFNLAGKDISDIDGYDKLPKVRVEARIGESSWAGLTGRLTPWIGDRQENAAWMWLVVARKTLLEKLGVDSIREAYKLNPEAVEALLRAEASDWFWWYGGDMGSPETFDPLFKAYLSKVYTSIGLSPPTYLNASFYPDGAPIGVLNTVPPKSMEKKPTIDGRLEANEWSDYVKAPIGLKYISEAYIGVDSKNLYILLKPVEKEILSDGKLSIAVYVWNPIRSVSPLHPGYNVYPRYGKRDLGLALGYEVIVVPYNNTSYVSIADGKGGWIRISNTKLGVREVVELAIPWNLLNVEPGYKIYLTIAVFHDKKLVETSTRLGRVYQVRVPREAITVGAKTVFNMKDPVGDDNGAGTYTYPTNKVFQPGVFDLTEFKVIDAGDRVIFETYVKNLGDNPWGGPNEFCLQYVQIYVRTTADLPVNNSTFGLNVVVAPEYAWHFALLLAPGWGADPVPKGERAALYYANGTVIVQDGDFKVYGDSARNAIVAEISKKLLPDVEHINQWKYVVVVTSYDGFGPERIRPFGVSSEEWTVGVGEKFAPAVAVGVIPRVMDLLAPTADDQYRMLSSFKVNLEEMTGTPAVIEGVGPGAQATVPITATITQTITATTTITSISTITITTTVTQAPVTYTTTVTTTVLEKLTLTPYVETTTVTEVVEYIPWHIAVGMLVIAVIVCALIALLASKRR